MKGRPVSKTQKLQGQVKSVLWITGSLVPSDMFHTVIDKTSN